MHSLCVKRGWGLGGAVHSKISSRGVWWHQSVTQWPFLSTARQHHNIIIIIHPTNLLFACAGREDAAGFVRLDGRRKRAVAWRPARPRTIGTAGDPHGQPAVVAAEYSTGILG